jgi:dTMP kinase
MPGTGSDPNERDSVNPEFGDPITAEFVPITTDAQALTNPAEILAAGEWRVRLFGSRAYSRLWGAQVASSLGDWLGFFAIAAIAANIGGGDAGASVGLVMIARIAPGFFFSQMAGVIVDRFDRKKVMVACDVVRAVVLLSLPFLNQVWQLVVLSLFLEVATLLWSPAKEASVPNLVPPEHLTTVNSLSLVAAYGTFPIAAVLFAGLAKFADWLSNYSAFDFLQLHQTSIAVYLDVTSFVLSAVVISSLPLPHRRRGDARTSASGKINVGQVLVELREGWQFIFVSPLVRAVMLGLATGLFGGGMLVPLGPVFAREVLRGGDSAYGLLLTALGFGVAAGVLVISALQKRLPKAYIFNVAVFIASAALLAAASMSALFPALMCVFLIGICTGTVYVIGFTILQENVEDELRGRIFSSLNTLVRFCLLMAFVMAPILSSFLGHLSKTWFNSSVHVFIDVALPGVRLTLWFAGLVIFAAGVIALVSLRQGSPNGRVRGLK